MDESPDPGRVPPSADDVTRLLAASAAGDAGARDELLGHVYAELHALARARMRAERAGHTLGATALVNEAYLRLFRHASGGTGSPIDYASRRSFFAAAATAMRRILVDHARSRAAAKRGGRRGGRPRRVALDVLEAASSLEPEEILSLDEAISRLEEVDERAATVVRLRFFGGLEIADVAPMLEVSDRTIKRDWEFARAWLHEAMHEAMHEAPDEESDHPSPG